MKPILIDALYINMGGALTVLNRLIDGCVEARLDFVLIKDARCPRLRSEDGVKKLVVMKPSIWKRHKYYKQHRNDYHSVLCMANVPPTVKMSCKVHTYFHNLSILMNQESMPVSWKMKNLLKRAIVTNYARNTDNWVVQTSNTESLIKSKLPWKGKNFYRFPIYFIPEEFKSTGTENGKDYVFVGNYTFAKGHDQLLEAWKLLHDEGINVTLHVTLWNCESFLPKVRTAVKDGVRIVNHGEVPFGELGKLYRTCKAVVYPSFNESLGLGIVEGLYAGCDIIASDLPFTHAICIPSEVFDPHSPQTIADAIKRYEKCHSSRSQLTIHDCLSELIELISEGYTR